MAICWSNKGGNDKGNNEEDIEYCNLPRAQTPFSDWERMSLAGGSEFERVLAFLAKKFARLKIPKASVDSDIEVIRQQVAFYRNLPDQHSFFHPPQELATVELSAPHQLKHGEVLDLTFKSKFEPIYQPFHAEFQNYQQNKTVYARMWRHPPGESLGQVIAIHGWFMGDQRINAVTLVPGFFFRLGLDVVLYELPHHGRRADANNSGPLFPSIHVARTNETMAQAIFELRTIAAWLKAEHPETPRLGVVGVSLGGYAAALWTGLDKLDFSIPIVPLVSMGDLAWKLLKENGTEHPRLLDAVNLDLLRAAYQVHCPLHYQAQTAPERRMIIASHGDSIIPAEQPSALWEHWGKPRIHWLEGGHLEQLSQGKAFREVHDFLLSHHLAHPELLDIKN